MLDNIGYYMKTKAKPINHMLHVLKMIKESNDNSDDIIQYVADNKVDVKELLGRKIDARDHDEKENELIKLVILSHKNKLLNFFVSHISSKEKNILNYVDILRTAHISSNNGAFNGICYALKLDNKEVEQIKKIFNYQRF
jgi:hypothetical protein